MAKSSNSVARFQTAVAALQRSISQDLHLPSLTQNQMQGFAALFVMVLPVLNSEGQPVFTDPILQELFFALDQRFGGCLVSSATSHPPYWGLWHPPSSGAGDAEKDYLITVQVFANPIEPASRFFAQLKQILKTAGRIRQEEILISRFDCWLI